MSLTRYQNEISQLGIIDCHMTVVQKREKRVHNAKTEKEPTRLFFSNLNLVCWSKLNFPVHLHPRAHPATYTDIDTDTDLQTHIYIRILGPNIHLFCGN